MAHNEHNGNRAQGGPGALGAFVGQFDSGIPDHNNIVRVA